MNIKKLSSARVPPFGKQNHLPVWPKIYHYPSQSLVIILHSENVWFKYTASGPDNPKKHLYEYSINILAFIPIQDFDLTLSKSIKLQIML